MARKTAGKVEIITEPWMGNVKPWRAKALIDGKVIGYTGACKTESAAYRAGQKLASSELAKTTKPTEPEGGVRSTGVEIRRMAGPCANGFERNGGTRWHALVAGRAICGARCKSFWSFETGEEVTCPRCQKKLEKLGLDLDGKPPTLPEVL
jgi:hypothetical protein